MGKPCIGVYVGVNASRMPVTTRISRIGKRAVPVCNVTNVSGFPNGSWSPLGSSKPQVPLRERPSRLAKRLAFRNGYDFFKADSSTVRHLWPNLDGIRYYTYFYSPSAAQKILLTIGELPLAADGKQPEVWEHFPPVR